MTVRPSRLNLPPLNVLPSRRQTLPLPSRPAIGGPPSRRYSVNTYISSGRHRCRECCNGRPSRRNLFWNLLLYTRLFRPDETKPLDRPVSPIKIDAPSRPVDRIIIPARPVVKHIYVIYIYDLSSSVTKNKSNFTLPSRPAKHFCTKRPVPPHPVPSNQLLLLSLFHSPVVILFP